MKILKNLVAVLLLLSFTPLATGQTTYLHTDYLGSVVAESNTAGTVTQRYYHEPYGESIGTGAQDEPGYTGHVFDGDLNLSYMQQRYYDPVIGRFYSNDPEPYQVGYPVSFNRFTYGNNNPYKYIDPNGELAVPLFYPFIKEVLVVSAAILGIVYVAAENSGDNTSSEEITPGTRLLGDLETIHDKDHPQNDPNIGELSDDELVDAIENPIDGQKVKVKGNSVRDGNTRINEAKERGFPDDMEIPVDELPDPKRDIDEDPTGGFGG